MKILAIDPGDKQSDSIWADIPGYEGIYQVSTSGSVRSLPRIVKQRNMYKQIEKQCPMRVLHASTDVYGYKIVSLCNGGKRKTAKVHRLVADAFLEKIDGKTQVNHKDGNKGNNAVSNLEWCNGSENKLHAFKIGLQKPRRGGEMQNAKPVIMTHMDGQEKKFDSITEACEYLGIGKQAKSDISKCCNGKTKTSHGHKWRFF